jgi:hypothetical protein
LAHFKKKLLFTFLCFLYTQNISGACTFKSSLFSKELQNPQNLLSIEVQIPDSRKWVINSLKIVTGRTKNIQKKYKDNFPAKIKATYNFGVCNFDARIRQNGDWKDHIRLTDEGKLLSSIDVKLTTGNILNSVRFKLLLPETRGSKNEILGSLILRHLNFLSPETFLVQATINDSSGTFLFQENAEKELLERNLRREGPIFEGDEKLIWSYKNFKNFDLENVSLAKLVNDNWPSKGDNSFIITLNAYQEIQRAYLQYANSNLSDADTFRLIELNDNTTRDFKNYALLLLAMNGSHGLRPHNRKFYFNAIEKKFEPIYYDGDLSLLTKFTKFSDNDEEFKAFLSLFTPNEILKLYNKLSSEKDIARLQDLFLLRAGNTPSSRLFFKTSLNQITENLNIFLARNKKIERIDVKLDNRPLMHNQNFIERLKKNNLDVSLIELIAFKEHESHVWRYNSLEPDRYKENISNEDLISVMSKTMLEKNHAVLLPNLNSSALATEFLYNQSFLDGDILASETMKLEIDQKNKKILIKQTRSNDWILFKGTSLIGWSIDFHGLKPVLRNDFLQRFNIYGLTGCLNFINTTFKKSNIKISNGQCEDSLNIMNSKGSLNLIDVTNSFSDGVDFDFSNISIDSISILNSKNDCIDVSGGTYKVKKIISDGCGDKGLSIGERSSFFGDNITVNNSNIGISTKDLSYTSVQIMSALSIKTCLEAIQKKQEFGGGYIDINEMHCKGAISQDDHSIINLNSGTHEL